MWGESSIFVDGPRVTNIARYGGKALALDCIERRLRPNLDAVR